MSILLLAATMRGLMTRAFTSRDAAAARDDTDPRITRARAEAEEVREMAHAYRRDDPSFANDLFAAADRHERLAEEQPGLGHA